VSETRVTALRKAWRKSAEHIAEQLIRFVRLTVLAAIPSVWDLAAGGHFDQKTLLAFILPFAEVAYRQAFPALGAAKADAAPGTVTTAGGDHDGLAPVPGPVQTDNGPRPEDGDQSDVSQDPNFAPPIEEEVAP
jgi:hypothetical protein